MTNEHLTDTEIQLFILEEEKCAVPVIEHIKHCPQCTIKAAEYKVLFEGMEQQEKPVFDFPLADLVIEQLPQSQRQDGFDKLFLYIMALVVIVFMSTMFYLFKDVRLNLEWKISSASLGLIITTIASMLVYLVTDMYRKYQKQMNEINFIK